MELAQYNLIVINSSGGKDSLCAIYEVCRQADEQGYPRENIVVSHQDLGRMEWEGTRELAERQAQHFGLRFEVSKYRNEDGEEITLLDYVRKRGKWPSNTQRYCTSDFKRQPGGTVVTKLTKDLADSRVLYVFGFRSSESPARKKKRKKSVSERLTFVNAHRSRIVREWLPIHNWSTRKVWKVIKDNDLPYHQAYNLGMPRLSCIFCIFSPFDALVVAGRANYELLEEYVQVEAEIGHTFREDTSLAEVKKAIDDGYVPKGIKDWEM